MFKNTLPSVLFLFLFFSIHVLNAQVSPTLIYQEDFDTPGEGVLGPQPVRIIPSTGAWRVSGNFSGLTAGSDYFLTKTEAGEGFLEAQDTDAAICFESDTIDISIYDSVIVSADIEEVGDLESSDYVDFVLLIDGVEYPLLNADNLGSAVHALVGDLPNDDDFGKVNLRARGVGAKLLIKICVKNNAGTEQFRIDKVKVEGFAASNPTPNPDPDSIQESFSLIDASTNQAIPGYDPIPEGANIDLLAIGTALVNFRYNTNVQPDQVELSLSRSWMEIKRLEKKAPFALFGHNAYNYFLPRTSFFKLLLFTRSGPISLKATPYSAGVAGTTKTLSFTISAGPWQLREGLEPKSLTYSVYPNPSQGNFVVKGDFPINKQDLSLQILNPFGQVIFQTKVAPTFTQKLDLRKHAEGIYLVQVIGKDFQQVQKLVLRK